MKKFLSLILTVVMALGNCTVFADEDKSETEQKPDVLAQQFGFCDFDGKGSIIGSGLTYFDGDEHKNVVEIPAYGAIGLNFGKKINSGKVVMSYDIKLKNKATLFHRTYTEVDRNGTYVNDFYVNSDGNMAPPMKRTYQPTVGPRAKYELNRWYGIDIWYDFDARNIKIYMDKELFGQFKMDVNDTEISSFGLLPTTSGVAVDNIGAVYIPSNGVVNMSEYPFVHYYDDEFDNAVQPWIKTGKLGDAFFGENLDFALTLVNNQDITTEGTAEVKYINSDGVSKSEQKEFTLNGYANKTFDFNIKNDCYGYAQLEANIKDKNGNLVGTSSKEISVVAKGEKNYKVGINDHISRHYYTSEQYELLDKAGIGVYRDGIGSMSLKESGEEVYDFIKRAEKDEDTRFLIALFLSPDGKKSIPIGDTEIKQWIEEFIKKIIDMTKNIKNIDFEIGNEFNYAIKNNPKTYNSKQYYEVCKAVYPVIKAARPDSRMFGCSSAATDNTETYLTELMEYGIGDYVDGFSMHPYDVFHGPEYDATQERIDGLHKILADYGYGDKPVVYTEYGWTISSYTGTNEQKRARWVPQSAILLTDYAISIEYYNLMQKKGDSDFEQNFGFVESYSAEVPYKPTSTFMTLSNYNRLLANTGNLKEYQFANGNVTVCTVADESGKRSAMAWVKEDKPDTNIAINIGTSSADIYDLYGNVTSVKTENGVLNLSLGQDPVYIMGDIGEISEEKTTMYVNERELKLVENDTGYITGKLPNSSYDIEAVCPDNIKADKAEIGADGSFRLKLNVGDDGQTSEKIRVKIKKGSDTVGCVPIGVSYEKNAKVTPAIIYYKDSYWQLKMKVQNQTNSLKLTGKVVLTEPSDFEVPSNQAEFKDIAPGGSKYMYVNIAPRYTKEKLDLKGYVEMSDGSKIDFSDTSYFVGLMYLSKEPTIDGKISPGEYNMNAPVKLNTQDFVVKRLADYPGLDETSGEIYLNYDNKNLYLAAKIYDSVEGATGDNTMVWQNDSIQLAFADIADAAAARTEYCIGKDNKGVPTITRYAFIGTKTVAAGGEGDAVAMGDDIKLEIGRDGEYTIYEFRIPWVEVFGEERPTLDKRTLFFSALINDNDGMGRTGYVEFCPGIGGEKNPALFSKIQAMK